MRSTRGLSRGCRTRAGSTTKPRAWAYSRKPSVKRGATGSATATMALQLSGMTTRKTPPKKAQASSNPSITASRVWRKVSQTNVWRLYAAVNTRPYTKRRWPTAGSGRSPRRPKSTCSSSPGFPSATRTVGARRPKPSSSAQNRWSVRYGTTHPSRASRVSILVSRRSSSSQSVSCARRSSSAAHGRPWPPGRAGRTRSQTAPMSASSRLPTPAAGSKPASRAASR